MKPVVLLLCAAVLAACAPRPKEPVTAPADFVAVSLGNAAEKAHGELALLAKVRGQGIQPLLPAPDPALDAPVAIAWTGPASGALKEICLKVGYRYQEMGTPSAQELIVVLQASDRSAHSLIEDVAWQVQPQAVVRVDPFNRIITLARSNVKAGGM